MGKGGKKSDSKQGTEGPPLERRLLGGGDSAFGLGEGEGADVKARRGCGSLSLAHWGTVFFPDKPRLEESGCPGNQRWLEGTGQMLACVAKGTLTPTVVCTWNGEILDLEVPQKATKSHTGTYCCTAANQLGSVSKNIAVVVQGAWLPLLPGPGWNSPRGRVFLSKHGKKKDFSGWGKLS